MDDHQDQPHETLIRQQANGDHQMESNAFIQHDQFSYAATEVDSEQARVHRIMTDPIEALIRGSKNYRSSGTIGISTVPRGPYRYNAKNEIQQQAYLSNFIAQ